MDQVLEELKQSKFYKLLFDANGDKILCVYVGGSRVYGLGDETSDYDIIVVTRNYHELNHGLYMTYDLPEDKHIKIEWFYNSLKSFTEEAKMKHQAFQQFEMNFINDEHILYKSEYAGDFLNLREKNTINGIDRGLRSIYLLLKEKYIDNLLADREDKLPIKTKYLYHLCVGYHYFMHTPMNKPYILAVKDTEYKDLPPEIKNYVLNCIRTLGKYIK